MVMGLVLQTHPGQGVPNVFKSEGKCPPEGAAVKEVLVPTAGKQHMDILRL